jgi:hypothetical protein
VNAFVYVEGGPSGADSKEGTIRCREGFHKLLDRSGFTGRKPRLVPLGGRGAVYDRFVTEHSVKAGSYVAMWIDSEEPMANIEAAWKHLENVETVDRWIRPPGADDDQVLFMTTCMETWIVADRDALNAHYGNELQESALPPLVDLELRSRHDVQKPLIHATRNCSNYYSKGTKSFEILGKLNPAALDKYLPSFVRVRRILGEKL